MKINKINVKNFRIYKDETFTFSPLTILTGPNSSGKSTLVKALMLLQDNILAPNYLGRLEFGQSRHSLGNFESILNDKNKALEFSVFFDVKNNKRGIYSEVEDLELRLRFEKEASSEKTNRQTTAELTNFEIIFHFDKKNSISIFKAIKNVSTYDIFIDKLFKKLSSSHYIFERIVNDSVFGKALLSSDESVLKKRLTDHINKEYNIEIELAKNNLVKSGLIKSINDEYDKKINKKESEIEENKTVLSLILKEEKEFSREVEMQIKAIERDLDILNSEKNNLIIEKFEKTNSAIESLEYEFSFKIEENLSSIENIRNFVNNKMLSIVEKEYKKYLNNSIRASFEVKGYTLGELVRNVKEWYGVVMHDLESFSELTVEDLFKNKNDDYAAIEIEKSYKLKNNFLNIKLRDLIENEKLKNSSKELLSNVQDVIEKVFQELPFTPISAMRGFQQRIYQTSQPKYHLEGALKVLLNMQRNPSLFKEQLNFINHWIVEFGIAQEGEQLRASIVEGDYIQGFFTNEAETTQMNIADKGLGISQLIPIIILTAEQLGKGHLLCIEEPGTHLHPDLQAKLIDFMLEAGDKGVQFLIETHSGVFLTALHAKILEKEDIINKVGLYFKSPDDAEGQETSFKQVEIDPEKGLEDNFVKYWKDFFDPYFLSQLNKIELTQMELDKINHYPSTLEYIVLTEDQNNIINDELEKSYLGIILDCHGFPVFDRSKCKVESYETSGQLQKAIGIAENIKRVHQNVKVIIHIDRDGGKKNNLLKNCKNIKDMYKKYDNKNIYFWITFYNDIEGYFLNEKHLHKLNPLIGIEEIVGAINQSSKELEDDSIIQLSRQLGVLSEVARDLYQGNPIVYRKSKPILSKVIDKLGNNLMVKTKTEFIPKDDRLIEILNTK